MANYLKVIKDVTVTSGNLTASFIVDELVSPYSIWAGPLAYASLVTDSGLVAPDEDRTPVYAYFRRSENYIRIFEVTDSTHTLTIDYLKAEVHGNSTLGQTFTIPSDENTQMDIGATIWVRQIGAGAITIAGQTGVVFSAPYGLTTPVQHNALFLLKYAPNTWLVIPQVGEGGGTGTTDTDDQTAAEVPFTPTGNLSATTVQSALAELDVEKETPAGAQAKADTAESNAEATAAATYQPLSTRGAANGYAPLDGNAKVPQVHLPAIALTDVSVVADILARDALVVQEGDVAIVLDVGDGTSSSFIHDGTDWRDLTPATTTLATDVTLSPTGDVSATNVQAGIAELAAEKQAVSQKGVANGYASLNVDGIVPQSQLPAAAGVTAIHGGTP